MRVEHHGNVTNTRATRRPEKTSMADYRLRRDEMPASLIDELDALRRFLTVRRLGAVDEPIKEVTAMKYEEHLRGLLGHPLLRMGQSVQSGAEAALPRRARRGAPGALQQLRRPLRSEGGPRRAAAASGSRGRAGGGVQRAARGKDE